MAGFVFDLNGIEAVLKDWEELGRELDEDKRIAAPMIDVVGPGDEPASWRVERRAEMSGVGFLLHNVEMRRYVNRYIEALTASRDAYLRSDESGRGSFTRGEGR
jgi:hypothetical protein